MPRRDDARTAETTRELEALDAALRGDGADAELAELVSAVRAERPAPSDPFAAELDARVAAGFPRRGRPAWRSRRALVPALAAAATLVLVAVIATSALRGRTDSPPPSSQTAQPGGAPSEPAESSVAPGTVPAAPGRRTRRVERRASLALRAPEQKIDEVAASVVRATDRAGGVVLTSNVASGAGPGGGASFELSVPSERLEPTLAALSRLADVKSRNQTSTDVTGAFVSPRERLTDALTEREALLRRLAKAESPNETASIRSRLRAASKQVARARAELRGLRERTSFSRVSVTVEAKEGSGSGSGAGWGLDDALRDALRILAVTLGVLLVALAVALPVALVAAALGLPARAVRRRRRQSALDAV